MNNNFCSEYLISVNYKFNSTSCFFENLSCYFLNEIVDETVIKIYYNSFDEAFTDAKAGKIQGVISIISNFTATMTERKIDWQPLAANQTSLDQIVINLDQGNLLITEFLKYRLIKIFEEFNKKVLRHCDLDENLENSPVNIEGFYGSLDNDFTMTLIPGLFAQLSTVKGHSDIT